MSAVALRVLLGATGSGGGVSLATALAALTTAGDGGWNGESNPKLVKYNGYTYAAWIDSSGNAECRSYKDADGSLGTIQTLHASLPIDIHTSPSLLVRSSDHKLMAFYTTHNDSSMRLRISTNSLSSDPTLSGGFAAEVNLDSQLLCTQYTYPTVFEQTSAGLIFLWFRDRTAGGTLSYATYSYSSDNGATWRAGFHLLRNAGNAFVYFKAIGDGNTKIHLITADGHPVNDAPTKLYHQYSDPTHWHKSDGTIITTTPPYAPSEGTLVYAGGSGSGWVHDVGLDGTGKPATIYWTGTYNQKDTDVVYARWNGSAWVETTIANENGGSGTGYGPGGAALDRLTVDRVYMARFDDTQWEMFLYTTTDSGATWTGRQLTTGSGSAAQWPTGVVGYGGSGLRAAWLRGTITADNSYSLAVEATGL